MEDLEQAGDSQRQFLARKNDEGTQREAERRMTRT